MIYRVIRAFIKLFGNYNDVWEYHSLYMGNIYFYLERLKHSVNKEVIIVANERKGKTIYSCTKDI